MDDQQQPVLFVLFVMALTIAGRKTPDQFEANCNRGCKCNRTTIICEKIGARDSDFFLTMRPEVYRDLDTVIVTGNALGPIDSTDLFGPSISHNHLTLLNMSFNGITAMKGAALRGMARLEYLYLNGNNVSTVTNDLLDYTSLLHVLDISAFFAKALSPTERSQILQNIFTQSRNTFTHLEEVIIENNGLTVLSPNTFCKIPGLRSLKLSGNRLTTFVVSEGCLRELLTLDLRNNRFEHFSVALWNRLPSVTSMDISKNPLFCDCQLIDFIETARSQSGTFVNQGQTQCASPNAGANLFDMKTCDRNKMSSSHFLLYGFLFVLAVCVTVVISRRQRLMRLLPTDFPLIGGYSQLKTTEEPQFV